MSENYTDRLVMVEARRRAIDAGWPIGLSTVTHREGKTEVEVQVCIKTTKMSLDAATTFFNLLATCPAADYIKKYTKE